jgi:hypothetical protein
MKTFLAALALLVACVAYAAPPAVNINPAFHPNLAAAQHLCRQAFDKISAAQGANHDDMEGHAKRAKELLEQASFELKLAAEAANRAGKK